ncbi:MAG: VCBS repeat-containing protein [Euryarchaeota archaeon]|nr:VCBS repeat-containing protein [Euryarchaeota archaeon]
MKLTTLLVMVLGIASVILACTSAVSAVPFDGESDVDIADHSGYLGVSVANAGDLNNDGYTDLVMGAHGANRAYVYLGGPSFDRFSDLTIADHTGASYFGISASNAGDLNNDGYTDLVIGAYGANKAFVYYGGPGFDGTSDVDMVDHAGESHFGLSVASAGDLNGDGYTDLVIGARDANKAFVYYGGLGFDRFSDLDIADHAGESGFGASVASAGDLNSDGYTDLVIGARDANKAFVYYGGPGFDGTSDVTIDDHAGETYFGNAIASTSDLNNDGSTDLVIGAHGSNKAFVYYGGPGFDGTSDVTIDDHTGELYFGYGIANAGDLNSDGYTDLVIGAYGANKAFMYYGGPDFDGKSDVCIADHTGATHFGYAVANAGDLNNDGSTDLVIGAHGSNKAYVYYGVSKHPTIVTLQGKLTNSTTGCALRTGSMRVRITDSSGSSEWQSTFSDCIHSGVFNIPLGAVSELRLIPGDMYQMTVDIDADEATYISADVTFGDNSPAGDVIKFVG